MNCLTGEGEDSRLSPGEMDQLIQNVSTRKVEGRAGFVLSWERTGGRGSFCSYPCPPWPPCSPQILEESDIDKDGTINLSEFQHIISRSPDFPR